MLEEFLIKVVWPLVSTASPAVALFSFVFMLKAVRDAERERTERVKVQTELNALYERALNGLHTSSAGMRDVAGVVESLRDTMGVMSERIAYIDRDRRR
jgi:hypothetical protein